MLDKRAEARFYQRNPSYLSARTKAEIDSFFESHPVWRRVSSEMRNELSSRISSAARTFRSFQAENAFAYLVGMTQLFQFLPLNILPIDRDRSMSAADKLFFVSTTFVRKGGEVLDDVIARWESFDSEGRGFWLTNAILCLEVGVCIDNYRIDAMNHMALALVYSLKDFTKAEDILKEAERMVPLLLRRELHSPGRFDEEVSKDPDGIQKQILMARREIARLRASI